MRALPAACPHRSSAPWVSDCIQHPEPLLHPEQLPSLHPPPQPGCYSSQPSSWDQRDLSDGMRLSAPPGCPQGWQEGLSPWPRRSPLFQMIKVRPILEKSGLCGARAPAGRQEGLEGPQPKLHPKPSTEPGCSEQAAQSVPFCSALQ